MRNIALYSVCFAWRDVNPRAFISQHYTQLLEHKHDYILIKIFCMAFMENLENEKSSRKLIIFKDYFFAINQSGLKYPMVYRVKRCS